MIDVGVLLDDLRAEGAEADGFVAELPAARWGAATPSAGWTVAHQVAHLAWTDERALLAVRDPAAFHDEMVGAFAGGDPQQFVDAGAADGAALPPVELLAWWRRVRADLVSALGSVWPGTKIPWYGPPMSAASMATARIMETWAHAGDVAEALGIARVPTVRIRHVAHIGVRTRDFAYLVRGRPTPAEPFRIELTGPDGALWTWGPESADQRVSGTAVDFCGLVTQRVHRDDTSLVAVGVQAREWLEIAQAFAGPPGPGRARVTS